jgi:hypothetical protein
MTIAEIAKERGVTAREVFVEEIEKRGLKLWNREFSTTGWNRFESRKHLSWVTRDFASLSIRGGSSSVKFTRIPYTAITIDLINAVAGEPKC